MSFVLNTYDIMLSDACFDVPEFTHTTSRRALFPLAWPERHERHRFDVPGSQVAPFDPRDPGATATLIAQGRLMALPIAPDASPPAGHTIYAERLDLRIGLSFTEVWELVLRRRFDLLVQRLVIIEGRRDGARKRDPGVIHSGPQTAEQASPRHGTLTFPRTC